MELLVLLPVMHQCPVVLLAWVPPVEMGLVDQQCVVEGLVLVAWELVTWEQIHMVRVIVHMRIV